MDLLELISISPIADSNNKAFYAMAFDRENFYFNRESSKAVYKYDQELGFIDRYDIPKKYTSICYDSKDDCYWAAVGDCNNRIFRLDLSFSEIDYIKIRPSEMKFSRIAGISYDPQDDTLFVTFNHGILEIDKSGNQTARQLNCGQLYLAALSVSPNYLAVYLKNSKQYIALYTNENVFIDYEIIPCDYIINNMILHKCSDDFYLYILAMKNRTYSYLLKFRYNNFY